MCVNWLAKPNSVEPVDHFEQKNGESLRNGVVKFNDRYLINRNGLIMLPSWRRSCIALNSVALLVYQTSDVLSRIADLFEKIYKQHTRFYLLGTFVNYLFYSIKFIILFYAEVAVEFHI